MLKVTSIITGLLYVGNWQVEQTILINLACHLLNVISVCSDDVIDFRILTDFGLVIINNDFEKHLNLNIGAV